MYLYFVEINMFKPNTPQRKDLVNRKEICILPLCMRIYWRKHSRIKHKKSRFYVIEVWNYIKASRNFDLTGWNNIILLRNNENVSCQFVIESLNFRMWTHTKKHEKPCSINVVASWKYVMPLRNNENISFKIVIESGNFLIITRKYEIMSRINVKKN